HRLPAYVYFDHSVHVAKGVACVECHGRVDQMPITWRVAPLQMQWCLACHANPAPRLHPPEEVFAPVQRTLAPQEVAALARLMQLRAKRELTECSTCHR